MNNPDDICKDCGLARREHHHDGGAYGLCGQFSEIAHSSNPRRIMNEREELLACPFCGGKPNLETYSMGSAAISCEECLVMSPMGADANMATRLWNRRCGLAQQRPMRADIAQIIDRGWKAGKSSNDVAEEILREFDPSPVSSTEQKCEPCEYCGNGKRTGLPGNACENCMNTGLKYPERSSSIDREYDPNVAPCDDAEFGMEP